MVPNTKEISALPDNENGIENNTGDIEEFARICAHMAVQARAIRLLDEKLIEARQDNETLAGVLKSTCNRLREMKDEFNSLQDKYDCLQVRMDEAFDTNKRKKPE